jgi:hypothetical protein
MLQGRCRFLLQRDTELQRHSGTPESAAHGSFIVGMSRGDAGNKEDTMNPLSPWSVVFFYTKVFSWTSLFVLQGHHPSLHTKLDSFLPLQCPCLLSQNSPVLLPPNL